MLFENQTYNKATVLFNGSCIFITYSKAHLGDLLVRNCPSISTGHVAIGTHHNENPDALTQFIVLHPLVRLKENTLTYI